MEPLEPEIKETIAGNGTIVDGIPKQGPFKLIVEWVPGTTPEKQQTIAAWIQETLNLAFLPDCVNCVSIARTEPITGD